MLGYICIIIIFNQVVASYFSYQAFFFYMTKKSKQKFKHLENRKSFQDEKKAFFIIYEGLLLKQIKQIFLEGESPTLR